jgi:uncharacterized membrane protein
MSLRIATESTIAPEPITSGADGEGRRSLDRIEVLDVLRGIALLGMFLVHFNDKATASDAGWGFTAAYQRGVSLFFEERFWAMFAILFGVGFAVQLRRAEARGVGFGPTYARRLAALAGFGLFATPSSASTCCWVTRCGACRCSSSGDGPPGPWSSPCS